MSKESQEQSITIPWFSKKGKVGNHRVSLSHGIASGGTGVVCQGTLDDGSKVAVKVLSLAGSMRDMLRKIPLFPKFGKVNVSSTTLEEAEKEVDMLKMCEGPFVVSMLGSQNFYFDYWVLLELCVMPCSDLLAKIKRPKVRGLLTLHIFSPILLALECMHKQGLVHRDIKPDNIMCTSRGVPKLCDFGISKDINEVEDSKKNDEFKMIPAHIGTSYYTSPEIIAHGKYDGRADIFSLGLVMLLGRTGWTAKDLFQKQKSHDVERLYMRMQLPEYKQTVQDSLWKGISPALEDFKGRSSLLLWRQAIPCLRQMIDWNMENRATATCAITSEGFSEFIVQWEAWVNKKSTSNRFTWCQTQVAAILSEDADPAFRKLLDRKDIHVTLKP